MEFKTYGTKAEVNENGDIKIIQHDSGDEVFVVLTPMEARMLLTWLVETLREKD